MEPVNGQQPEAVRQEGNTSILAKNNIIIFDLEDPAVIDDSNIDKPRQSSTNEVKPSQLKIPYDFMLPNSSCLQVVVPHFNWKSLTFVLSVLMSICTIVTFVVYANMDKNPVSWSCLLYTAQAKFYPRLRYNYQLWRIITSAIFHGNISHFVLNIISMQLYGYFAEWYYGRSRYALALVSGCITSHLLSCLTNTMSVASTASGILYTIIGLKIAFFFKYRTYQELESRRLPLYALLFLASSINLIVLFVGSNVDYGGHIAGLLTGLMLGVAFYEGQTTRVKVAMSLLIAVSTLGLLVGCFSLSSQYYLDLNHAIITIC